MLNLMEITLKNAVNMSKIEYKAKTASTYYKLHKMLREKMLKFKLLGKMWMCKNVRYKPEPKQSNFIQVNFILLSINKLQNCSK